MLLYFLLQSHSSINWMTHFAGSYYAKQQIEILHMFRGNETILLKNKYSVNMDHWHMLQTVEISRMFSFSILIILTILCNFLYFRSCILPGFQPLISSKPRESCLLNSRSFQSQPSLTHWEEHSKRSTSHQILLSFQMHRIIQVRMDLRRSSVESLAQSRVSCVIRPSCSGLYPAWSWHPPGMETAQNHLQRTRLVAIFWIVLFKFPLPSKWSSRWSASELANLFDMKCAEAQGEVRMLT